MSDEKKLKPAPGCNVRKPDRSHLAADGEAVEMSSYWHRRIADGDVIEVEVEKKPARSAASASK